MCCWNCVSRSALDEAKSSAASPGTLKGHEEPRALPTIASDMQLAAKDCRHRFHDRGDHEVSQRLTRPRSGHGPRLWAPPTSPGLESAAAASRRVPVGPDTLAKSSAPS